MNIAYLNNLPEVENIYDVDLDHDEKVVFTAKLTTFGTEKDEMLGNDSRFTLTNKRMIANNGVGVWTVDVAEDVISCERVDTKFLFKKLTYFSVDLNTKIVFEDGFAELTGFHFYFNGKDTKMFDEIINHSLN